MNLIKAFGSLSIQSRSFVSARSLHPKKFKSILADIPVRPRSAWQVYVRENMHKYKSPDGKGNAAKATQELSSVWKTLGEAEKKVYQAKYEAEAKAHDESIQKALSNATPKQFKEENELRKKYKLAPLKDPKQPKRAKNSFLLYLDHLRAINDPAILSKSSRLQVSEAAKKYRSLSEEEIQFYKDKAKPIQEQYTKELRQYNVEAGIVNK